jgi:capsular polysaccharide transport system permease protein
MSLTAELTITSRVITAIILRETKTRFGRNQLGYLWAILEPAVYIGIFLLIRSSLQTVIPFGESLALFFLTGLLCFRMFSSVATRGLSSITANRALLAYPPVKPNDVIAARLLLEVLTMYVVFFVFFAALTFIADSRVIVHQQRFAAALAALTLLSIGVGTFNGVISVIYPFWERVWGLLRLPLLLLSGIFYVPGSLPPLIQDILWWNPIIHCVEWLRYATYLTYEPMLSQPYAIGFGIVSLVFGLAMEYFNRYRLLES